MTQEASQRLASDHKKKKNEKFLCIEKINLLFWTIDLKVKVYKYDFSPIQALRRQLANGLSRQKSPLSQHDTPRSSVSHHSSPLAKSSPLAQPPVDFQRRHSVSGAEEGLSKAGAGGRDLNFDGDGSDDEKMVIDEDKGNEITAFIWVLYFTVIAFQTVV